MQNAKTFGRDLRFRLSQYAEPNSRSAAIQLLNTIPPYISFWALMFWVQKFSILALLLLAIPTGLFLVRIFILQHDCGHLSFVPSKKGNDRIGFFLGLLTFTPILNWRLVHNLHHATSGNLDRRDKGDIWTLTRREYEESSLTTKFKYRLYRNPLFLFVFGPGLFFLIRRRFPIHLPKNKRTERRDVHLTNLGISLIYGTLGLIFGLKALLLVLIPVASVGASVGVWLFYVQHQYEEAYWVRGDSWSLVDAGLEGSSYYALPKWLNWFTADIAVHHIHHVESRIPNYKLRQCMTENKELAPKNSISLSESWKLAKLKLWDESKQELVGYEL